MIREEATDGSMTKTDAKIRKEWDDIEIRFLFGITKQSLPSKE